MADTEIQLTLKGREETEARLPAVLQPAARSIGKTEDPFLPSGYLTPKKTFDVSISARSGTEDVAERQHAARADEVVVLELADGGTFITSARRLRETLALTHPELLGPNGEMQLEKLRAEGAAPRGFLTDAVGGLVSKVFTLLVGEKNDAIIEDALGDVGNAAALGVSWAGTKALMWAIEKRLEQPEGLYRWTGASGVADDLETVNFAKVPAAEMTTKPLLVFIHGTGSSTLGSFGDLRAGDRELWAALESKYRRRHLRLRAPHAVRKPDRERVGPGERAARRRPDQPGVALARRAGGRPAVPGGLRPVDRQLSNTRSRAPATPTRPKPSAC